MKNLFIRYKTPPLVFVPIDDDERDQLLVILMSDLENRPEEWDVMESGYGSRRWKIVYKNLIVMFRKSYAEKKHSWSTKDNRSDKFTEPMHEVQVFVKEGSNDEIEFGSYRNSFLAQAVEKWIVWNEKKEEIRMKKATMERAIKNGALVHKAISDYLNPPKE